MLLSSKASDLGLANLEKSGHSPAGAQQVLFHQPDAKSVLFAWHWHQ